MSTCLFYCVFLLFWLIFTPREHSSCVTMRDSVCTDALFHTFSGRQVCFNFSHLRTNNTNSHTSGFRLERKKIKMTLELKKKTKTEQNTQFNSDWFWPHNILILHRLRVDVCMDPNIPEVLMSSIFLLWSHWIRSGVIWCRVANGHITSASVTCEINVVRFSFLGPCWVFLTA